MNNIKEIKVTDEWPEAISDGLTLVCSMCGYLPKFDYFVDSDFWHNVASERFERDVICLPCLDQLAHDKGLDIGKHLESVQFTGIEKTIILYPDRVYCYTEYLVKNRMENIMIPYPKIESIFVRDKETFKFVEGEWRRPEFEYLKDCDWVFKEKLHGINTRIFWDGDTVRFGGRTDRAQMPVTLMNKLIEMFSTDKFKDYDPLCLYGEGIGAGINKGGNYVAGGVDFVLFDVRIGEWWLRQDDICDVANKLEIDVVPTIDCGCKLLDAVKVVKDGLTSYWGDFEAEGIVARPAVDLRMRSGERLLVKIKGDDFARNSDSN